MKTTDEIKQKVKRVLDYSNDMDCKVDKLINSWQLSKSGLFDLFGGKLEIESPGEICVDKPYSDKLLEFRLFVDDIAFDTINEELRMYLLDQGVEAFYANSTKEKWFKYGFNVSKGMKVSKALKFFIKEKEVLDKWQTNYSRILQDSKLCGRLCLSIDPLDYLSISENAHNWRSCHSLDGEYRCGNLSYMADSVTIVAYLKSEKDYKLPNFPKEILWNSKKWRMLLYLNKDRDLIFSSKPYPFDNDILVQSSFKMLEQLCVGSWQEHYTTLEPDDAMEFIGDSYGSLQYNDCLSSISYNPRYKTLKNVNIEDCAPIEVGGMVYCLDCEEEIIEFGANYSCSSCGDYEICENCDCNMEKEEACVLGDQVLCADCYDDLICWCNGCGEVVSREDPELVFDDLEGELYCSCCYDDLIEGREEEE